MFFTTEAKSSDVSVINSQLGVYFIKKVYLSVINHITPITMKEGKVKFFNNTKGFGFITDQENGTEYFVHVSGLIDRIKDEDNVTFELQEGKKGLNAINVKVAG